MIGNGVATHIAFLAIGLPKLLPSLAGPTVPATGHSISAASFSRTLAASALSVSGRTVLISMKSFPATFPESRPLVP